MWGFLEIQGLTGMLKIPCVIFPSVSLSAFSYFVSLYFVKYIKSSKK